MIEISILAQDNNVIPYRKELNKITGKVTATLLLQQLIYWDDVNKGEEFYKFIDSCGHEKYNEGDSWCEELGFTRKEFLTACKILVELSLMSKRTNNSRMTFYKLNRGDLAKALKGIYLNDKKGFTKSTKGDLHNSKTFVAETTTETTTDINKNKQKKVSYDLPENVDAELFSDYLILRKSLRAPVTQRAINSLIKKLNDYKAQGFNPNEIIEQAYENGWKSFYVPKQQSNNQSFQQQDRETRDAKIDYCLENNIFDMIDAMEETTQEAQQGAINA